MKKRDELKTLRMKSKKELVKLLNQNYKKLTEYNFSVNFRKLKNIQLIGNTKKSIARIWTIISEMTNKDLQKQ